MPTVEAEKEKEKPESPELIEIPPEKRCRGTCVTGIKDITIKILTYCSSGVNVLIFVKTRTEI